jgi:hypothetical protein
MLISSRSVNIVQVVSASFFFQMLRLKESHFTAVIEEPLIIWFAFYASIAELWKSTFSYFGEDMKEEIISELSLKIYHLHLLIQLQRSRFEFGRRFKNCT